MPKRAVRISVELDEKLRSTAKQRGYQTPSAFLRFALENEIKGRNELTNISEQVTASLEQLRRD